jgi:hypothetical protein
MWGDNMGLEYRLDDAPSKEPKRTPFEVLTQLVVPSLLVVATIVSLMKDQRRLAWSLVGVLVLSLLIGLYPLAASWAKARARRRRDERTARRAFPALRRFVEQFGEFVSVQRSDTLHYIAQSDVCGGNADRLNKLGMPNANPFYLPWHNTNDRVASLPPNLTNFKATTLELGTFISLYNNYCMRPVFELLPQELRGQLSGSSKSSLEACRERFVAFLADYSKYLKHFDQAFAARYLLMREFPSPKPLS